MKLHKGHLFLLLSLIMVTHKAEGQRVVIFSFEEDTGSTTTLEAISSTTFAIRNNFNRPERIVGVRGSALRFDGWSTWVEREPFVIPEVTQALTIECWYATESFTAANAAIISQEDGTSGITLEIEPYGKVVFIFWADDTRYVLVTENTLEKYTWNHIVATVDLVRQESRIYVNGTLWKELPLAVHANINLSPNTFYLGRDTDLQEFAGFPLTVINGALDELSIYKHALSGDEVAANYSPYATLTPDLTIDPRVRHANDPLRPMYHAMPNTSWTNESYGLIFYNGKYHLFFQKNPNGPYLYFMHWGHLTSTDLVSWQEEKIALSPSPGFDSHGVWSGTTIKDPAGRPVIFYTGVNGVKAGIGLALPMDEGLLEWEESPHNPVIPEAPADVRHLDFRDPFVWKHHDTYYMIVGSGLQFGGGGYLFTYKSSDLISWTRIDALYHDTNVSRSGEFWEMPFFYPLNDTEWILSVTPPPSNGARAKTIYWIGTFTGEKFVPYDVTPKSLELISDNLLAPAIASDENGRTTYLGIIPEDRNTDDQVRSGWRHTFSLPRVVRLLKDSTIGHFPHPNLCRLREGNVSVMNRIIGSGSKINLPEIAGNQVELDFKLRADSAARFSIQVLKHEDESEYTALHFNLEENTITLDRSKASLSDAAKDIRQAAYVFDHHETIKVNIFIDHSVLEIFVDNIVVFSCRVYPSSTESRKVDLVVNSKTVEVINLEAWQMKDMTMVENTLVCEPDPTQLPDRLRKIKKPADPVLSSEGRTHNMPFQVYPNPAMNIIKLNYPGKEKPDDTFKFRLFSSSGVLITDLVMEDVNTPVDISALESGVYYAEIEHGGQRNIFRLMIVR